MQNQTQLVRGAITIFIIVAVSVSMVQELINVSQKPSMTPEATAAQGQGAPVELSGPKIPGIRVLSSDKFQGPVKQILARNKLNVEIGQYEFEGNEYWMNMVVNWGHVLLIFYFMNKHKAETDESKKKQTMIMGAVAVVAWFYFSPQLKPQKLALQVHGSKVYDKDVLIEPQFVSLLNQYEFQIDDQAEQLGAGSIPKEDAWQATQQQQQHQKPPQNQQPILQEPELEF